MSRRRIIAGNWKMNKTPSEAVALVNELLPLVKNDDVDVVFCVPAIDIVPVVEAVKGSNVNVGAENLYFEESGAYTGGLYCPENTTATFTASLAGGLDLTGTLNSTQAEIPRLVTTHLLVAAKFVPKQIIIGAGTTQTLTSLPMPLLSCPQRRHLSMRKHMRQALTLPTGVTITAMRA